MCLINWYSWIQKKQVKISISALTFKYVLCISLMYDVSFHNVSIIIIVDSQKEKEDHDHDDLFEQTD